MCDMIQTESKISVCVQSAFYGNSTSTWCRCSCTTTSFLILYVRRFLSPFPRIESTSWCAALESSFSHRYTCAALKHQLYRLLVMRLPGDLTFGCGLCEVGLAFSFHRLCCWLLDLVQHASKYMHSEGFRSCDLASDAMKRSGGKAPKIDRKRKRFQVSIFNQIHIHTPVRVYESFCIVSWDGCTLKRQPSQEKQPANGLSRRQQVWFIPFHA